MTTSLQQSTTSYPMIEGLQWQPHPAMHPTELPSILDMIKSFPHHHYCDLQAGEEFATPKECLERVQNYAFLKGFAVVTETATKDRVVFQCIHHDTETKNKRQLADKIKDLDTTPTSGLELDPMVPAYSIQNNAEQNTRSREYTSVR
jgi:hypothetical protein